MPPRRCAGAKRWVKNPWLNTRAGVLACLFLLFFPPASAQTPAPAHQVLQLILNLEFTQARTAAKLLPPPHLHYFESLADMLELFVLEDRALFNTYENNWQNRLEQVSQLPSTAEKMHVLAELRLQWAFVNLKFGNELQAAWQLRQSYLAAQVCRQKYPQYEPIRKTWGILNMMLGSIPAKYQWVLQLFSLNGKVETGLLELSRSAKRNAPHGIEARILLALTESFLLQQHENALARLKESADQQPAKLVWFLASAIALKSARADEAMAFLDSLIGRNEPCPVAYAYYLYGEALLSAGNYSAAKQSYALFIQYYRGENFIKDAWYKMGVCYALLNNRTQAEVCFDQARKTGTARTEADRYADHQLSESPWPHPVNSRLRYATDGGYYKQAMEWAQQHMRDSFATKKDSVEFLYRLARLFHRINQTDTSLVLYALTIDKAGRLPWYYAPNACLQSGYIFQQRGDYAKAEQFFRKALSYPQHPYKNSIDSKAQTALAELRKNKRQ